MDISINASVLGEDPERGGAQCKVWLYHDGKIPIESAKDLLTKLKRAMTAKNYEVIRDPSDGSFILDGDGEKVLESSYGGKCLSILFTHSDSNLPEEKLVGDVNDCLANIEIAAPEKKRGK